MGADKVLKLWLSQWSWRTKEEPNHPSSNTSTKVSGIKLWTSKFVFFSQASQLQLVTEATGKSQKCFVQNIYVALFFFNSLAHGKIQNYAMTKTSTYNSGLKPLRYAQSLYYSLSFFPQWFANPMPYPYFGARIILSQPFLKPPNIYDLA